MEKRNKLWRRRHMWRLFKERLVRQAAWDTSIWDENSNKIQHPYWLDFVKEPWCQPYRTTGRPCSCWLCKRERYNRKDYKKDTKRIIDETMD